MENKPRTKQWPQYLAAITGKLYIINLLVNIYIYKYE
jgi:hypothetical protein